MTACAAWVAAEYLVRHGLRDTARPCRHSPDRCPPLTRTTPTVKASPK